MKRLLVLLSISTMVTLLTGCEIAQQVNSIGKTDFEILYDYAVSNGEFGTNENGNHYYYAFTNTDYAMWIYQDGLVELIYFDNDSLPEITVLIEYYYGELGDGFMLLYSYLDEDFDDFGYDDDALYLETLNELIVIFDDYDGLTKDYDESIAEEYGLDMINYVDRYFRNQIGIDLK